MECNKDEGLRAKEIAERKFETKDYLGARKFALKAHSLFPDIGGVKHMLSSLDVYISSEERVNGVIDCYKVLKVDPNADDETIKKQHRKLALVLHPDKNQFRGADGAFKIIQEAYNVLSDKAKRSLHDQSINIKTVKPNVPPCGSNSNCNGVSSSSKSMPTPKPAAQKGKETKRKTRTPVATPPTAAAPAPPSQQKYQASPTFWTVCHRCRMHHEYLRKYLYNNLVCATCRFPFYAEEYPPPATQFPNMPPAPQVPNMPPAPQVPQVPSHWQGFLKKQHGSTTSSIGSGPSNKTNSQWSAFHQEALEKAKKDEQDKLKTMRGDTEADLKRKNMATKREAESSVDANVMKKRKVGDGSKGPNSQGSKVSFSEPEKCAKKNKPKSSKDVLNFEIPKKELAHRARLEIQKKVNEWKSSSDMAGSASTINRTVTGTGNVKSNDSKKGNKKESELKSMSVPDSDFHDFDQDRAEMCFQENQVWAVYDSNDGMPRYYAIIQKVISVNPFKVRMSWLNSKTNAELGPLNWVGSGFIKTCGEFRVGKREISESLNSFSHMVRWTKGEGGAVLVFPRKGDVWALYRNWSPSWNNLTEDSIVHVYDMVEVLDDYDEEIGVRVCPLVKVAGFKTVFCRHRDEMETKIIPREELFRFSHQVPAVSLSGKEGENAPKGCLELDPAASPLELLQVIPDGNSKNM